jgi:hypothetical protein
LIAIGGVVVAGSYFLYRQLADRGTDQSIDSFTLRESQLYDSLMVESTRSIERGSTLLDLGLPDPALEEFAKAIAVFESSILATNRFVRPTIDGLAATIQEIYRYNQLAAPAAFARGAGKRIDLSKSLNARLSPEQFQVAVDRVKLGFERRFSRPMEITGADHPEHVSLYGRGGALDIRVKNLTQPQISFLITAFGSQGVRVKDFSNDAILQRQIRAAIAAGLADRAGTGLHLHIDRFRDRRDRYTVTSSHQSNAPTAAPNSSAD